MRENRRTLNFSKESIDKTYGLVASIRDVAELDKQFENINEYTFEWLCSKHSEYMRKDYGDVFEKYINN